MKDFKMKPLLLLLFCILFLNAEPIKQQSSKELKDFDLQRYSYIGDIKKVKESIFLGASIDSKDDENMSALMWAAYKNREEVVKFLVENGANINFKSQSGKTILHYAIMNKNDNLIKYLLSKNIEITQDSNVVFKTVSTPNLDSIKLLLNYEKDLNRFFTISEDDKYRKTETTLLLASINAKNLDIARELIKKGASIDLANSRAETPLLCAMRKGLYDFASELISMGANVDALDIAKNSVLSYAIKAKQTKLALSVIPNTNLNILFSEDVAKERPQVYESFISSFSKEQIYTYLQLASMYGEIDVAKELIKRGLDINTLTNTKYLSLDAIGLAILKNQFEMFKFLIENYEIDLYKKYQNKNYQGSTGLYYFAGGYSKYTLFELVVNHSFINKNRDILDYVLSLNDINKLIENENELFYKNLASLLYANDDKNSTYTKLEEKIITYDKQRYINIKNQVLLQISESKKPNVHKTEINNSTLISNAVTAKDLNTLLKMKKSGINIVEEVPYSLFVALSENGDKEFIKQLVEIGFDLNYVWSDKTFAVSLVKTLKDNPSLKEILEYIVSKKADLNKVSVLLEYLLTTPKDEYDNALIDYLIKNKANFGEKHFPISKLFTDENVEILEYVLSNDSLKKALKESIIKCDATKVASYINSFNSDDSYTNDIERVFEFAYANNIAINHKEIFLDKKTTSEVKKLAKIYMNDNEK